ncbi:MAG TPA: nuclear transport factor 2 family protein [Amnibacterium sp.]|nr:nuclear transport factor 2 family protein [Amnibacterium sp.]
MAEAAGDEAAVRRAAADLVAAFGAHDTAAYFGAFAPEATFVFHTTPERLPDRASYERLWRRWEQEDGFRVHGCESRDAAVQLLGDAAVFVHDVTTDLELGGARSTVQERETIVFERRGSGWLAVHEHLSPRPEQEENA